MPNLGMPHSSDIPALMQSHEKGKASVETLYARRMTITLQTPRPKAVCNPKKGRRRLTPAALSSRSMAVRGGRVVDGGVLDVQDLIVRERDLGKGRTTADNRRLSGDIALSLSRIDHCMRTAKDGRITGQAGVNRIG